MNQRNRSPTLRRHRPALLGDNEVVVFCGRLSGETSGDGRSWGRSGTCPKHPKLLVFVEPTHLKNMRRQNGMVIFPQFWGVKNKK